MSDDEEFQITKFRDGKPVPEITISSNNSSAVKSDTNISMKSSEGETKTIAKAAAKQQQQVHAEEEEKKGEVISNTTEFNESINYANLKWELKVTKEELIPFYLSKKGKPLFFTIVWQEASYKKLERDEDYKFGAGGPTSGSKWNDFKKEEIPLEKSMPSHL